MEQILFKKILGIYATRKETFEVEIYYHNYFMVDSHPAFLNLARHTHIDFGYDTTGTIRSLETRARMAAYRSLRSNTLEHLTQFRENVLRVQAIEHVCPYCEKKEKAILCFSGILKIVYLARIHPRLF